MARKYITKKITVTTVNGFTLGEDGQPVPASIPLAGKYTQEKATKEVRKNHDENFMVTGIELSEEMFKIALTDFVKFARALTAEEAANATEGESEDESGEDAENAPAEKPAKGSKK